MSSLSPLLRRSVCLVAAPVLTLGALAATPAPSYAAADPTPVDNGAAWLAGELTDGLMHNDQFDFDDLGLTVDTGLALSYLDRAEPVSTIAGAIAPVVADYYSYYVAEGKTHVAAGSLAKAAVFADAAGKDASDFGGRDLAAELADRVSTDEASAGRISDVFFPEEPFESDFSNTIGQSFAVLALDNAENGASSSAANFLIAQQCAEGFFRTGLGADLADTCDSDEAASASTDTTALALLNLDGLGVFSTGVDDAKSAAVAWLLETQAADGSWGGEAPTAASNANSTGLAGWALGVVGETEAAAKAATWLRARQADDFGPCTTGLTVASGAIAYDDAALAAGRSEGIEVSSQDQFRRASAQALPALQWAPAGTYASEPTSTEGFVRAGSAQDVQAEGLAPGQTVCFARGASQDLVNADVDGNASGSVTLPAGSGTRRYDVGLTDGVLGSITFRALDAKTFKVGVKKKRVPATKKQKVTVKGLAVGESVRVKYDGKVVGKGVAGADHRFSTTFKVGKQTGKQKVRIRGEFGNRTGAQKFRVVKAR